MRVLFSTLTQVLFSQHDISFFLRGAWIVSLSVIEHFDKTWFSPATFLILVFLPLGFEVQSHEIAEEALQTGHKKFRALFRPLSESTLRILLTRLLAGEKLDATDILLIFLFDLEDIDCAPTQTILSCQETKESVGHLESPFSPPHVYL